MTADVERSGQSLLQPLGNRDRILWRADVVEQDRELVATEARRRVGRPQVGGDPFGHTGKQGVAKQVTKAVVDELEAVEVEEQHREMLVGVTVRSGHRHSQPVEEQRAVRQPRQGVVQRGVPELAFKLLAFVDVGQRPDHAGGHAVRAADNQRPAQHPQVAAVAATDAVLEFDTVRPSGPVLLDRHEQARQVVLMNAAEPVVAGGADRSRWGIRRAPSSARSRRPRP